MQERKYDEAMALNFKQGTGFGINTVINVADYFDVSVDYLLGRTGVRKIGD